MVTAVARWVPPTVPCPTTPPPPISLRVVGHRMSRRGGVKQTLGFAMPIMHCDALYRLCAHLLLFLAPILLYHSPAIPFLLLPCVGGIARCAVPQKSFCPGNLPPKKVRIQSDCGGPQAAIGFKGFGRCTLLPTLCHTIWNDLSHWGS